MARSTWWSKVILPDGGQAAERKPERKRLWIRHILQRHTSGDLRTPTRSS
jgi:hypothetical protein